MKTSPFIALVACLGLVTSAPFAAAADVKAELGTLVQAVLGKLQAGERSAEGLSAELKKFDELLASHAGEKTEDVAQVLYMKAAVFSDVLGDFDQAIAHLRRLKVEFPGTALAARVDSLIPAMEARSEMMRQQKTAQEEHDRVYAIGKPFPDFAENDLDGKPLSLANYKGKVVLLDFWATWCGPCIAELPTVVAAYKKHHPNGFEIIGISLDRADWLGKLKAFAQEHEMPWVQFYDGKYWDNKLAVRYGIRAIPATFLLDGEGRIIGKDLRGPALDQAIAKALGKPAAR